MPLLAAAFVENAYERDQWTPFWLTTASIMGTSGLVFLFFGVTRRQEYAPVVCDLESPNMEPLRAKEGSRSADQTARQLSACCKKLAAVAAH